MRGEALCNEARYHGVHGDYTIRPRPDALPEAHQGSRTPSNHQKEKDKHPQLQLDIEESKILIFRVEGRCAKATQNVERLEQNGRERNRTRWSDVKPYNPR